MSKNSRVEATLRLDSVRISFPDIFKPVVVEDGQKPSYGAHFILEKAHPQVGDVKRIMQLLAKEKWGENGTAVLKELIGAGRVCFRDGNSKTGDDGTPFAGYADAWFISARSPVRPTVVGRNREPLTEEDGVIYSGCYVNAFLALWVQTGQYGKRINAQLKGVQFNRPGESLGGATAASPDVFDTLGDEFADGAEPASAGDSDDIFG